MTAATAAATVGEEKERRADVCRVERWTCAAEGEERKKLQGTMRMLEGERRASVMGRQAEGGEQEASAMGLAF